MDLIAISYHNIGPFFEKTVSLNFKSGAYLIKAPIGTGKSFLFFDGPMYALYKSGSRPMVSRQAKSGWIHCIFFLDGQFWYIQRNIKTTKAGNDSTQSRLFSLSGNDSIFEKLKNKVNSLSRGVDICEQFTPFLEEVIFENQRDLDHSLQALLPPKEVMMTVHLMMQDSDHIFELPPQQRIGVFKHLFGLLGIDEAKGKLQERKKELVAMKSVLDDTDSQSRELRKGIQALVSLQERGNSLELSGILDAGWTKIITTSFMQDIEFIQEKISIKGLSLDKTLVSGISSLMKDVQSVLLDDAKKRGVLDQRMKLLKEKATVLEELERKFEHKKKTIDSLKNKLSTSQLEGYDSLKKQYEDEKQGLESLEKQFDSSLFTSVGCEINSLKHAAEKIGEWIEHGKDYKSKLALLHVQSQQFEKQMKDNAQRYEGLVKQRDSLKTDYQEKMNFHCDKIDGDCPYVEVIKGATGGKIQQQMNYLQDQIDELEMKKTSEQFLMKRDSLLEEEKLIQKNIHELTSKLQTVSWNEVMGLYKEYELVYEKTKRTYGLLGEKEKIKEKHKEDEMTLIQGEQELIMIQQQKEDLLKEIETAKTEIDLVSGNVNDISITEVQQLQEIVVSMEKCIDRLEVLITAHNQQLKKKHDVENEIGIVKDLYQIFSKELMIVVLQDFLPQLQEVINAYLSQVVSYEIHFLSPQTLEEGIELEVEIRDEHGIRPVKSLSGGQRAILKIAWILAISSLLKSKFLFLDETITSLDSSTVADVAEMIDQFVKGNDMKLYVVTHAPQIQEMTIRDDQIEVKSNNNK